MKTKQELSFVKSEVLRKREARLKRNDKRPICDCEIYPFPHKIGGKCKGQISLNFILTIKNNHVRNVIALMMTGNQHLAM